MPDLHQFALVDVAPAKKQIMSSRSFGAPVERIEELQEAVASYLERAAEKLRRQGSDRRSDS